MWLFYATLAAVLWGLNYTLAERILEAISPLTLLAIEMLIGAIIFLVMSYFSHLKSDIHILTSQPMLLTWVCIEIVTIMIANFCIVYSIKEKNATVAGMIELSYPLFTILFTWLLFRINHLNLSVIMGGTFIIIGMFFISFA